jgi:hypothetical protein
MLVTFSTHAHENITMFGDVALRLIKMMGHSGVVPSAILAKDVPQALEKLTQALAVEKKPVPIKSANQDSDDDDEVSLLHRAIPLMDLLKDAIKHEDDVMWK